MAFFDPILPVVTAPHIPTHIRNRFRGLSGPTKVLGKILKILGTLKAQQNLSLSVGGMLESTRNALATGTAYTNEGSQHDEKYQEG
jgi:hypothetical protein